MTEKTGPGCRSKLTPEVQETITKVIRAGNYAFIAAEYVGISQTTFYRWLELGEQEEAGPYWEFRDAVKRAAREAEVRAVATVQKHMGTNWQAAMTYLERKFPKRWGRRMDVTSAGQPVGTIRVVCRDPQTSEDVDFKIPPPTLPRPPEE